MVNYDEHKNLIREVELAQDADEDLREYAREAQVFLEKRDGQWESDVIQRTQGQPRYTDDRVNPIIDQVVTDVNNSEFTIRVRPSGSDATKEIAKTYDGLIRAIRNISGFEHIRKNATRNMICSGIAGWEITQDYSEGDSFDQDLYIRSIHNYEDRVWIDPYSLEQDNKDANWGVILDYVSKDEYEAKFPEGSGLSLSQDRQEQDYWHKPDFIVIGRAFYRKTITRELVKMSNGAVYEDNEDFKMLADEFEMAGIVEESRRSKESYKVFMRYYDGGGWLNDEEETVFSYIPIVTTYANFKIIEGKRIYRGAVEKLMDIQRVHNYAFSREIAEVALAPRAKWWMTTKQAKGHEKSLATLNTNMNPVQFYNPDEQAAGPPQQNGGAVVNPAIRTLVESTDQAMNSAAGIFAANQGDNPNLQSGIAIEQQISQGNNVSTKYFDAINVAIEHTGRILIDAIPRVYDATRQIKVLGEDGTQETVTINQQAVDQQTGELVTLEDLSQGVYEVTVDMGPSYKNKQAEAAEMFAKISQADPSIMEIGRDVWFKNIEQNGFDQLAERARAIALNNGVIPFEQMTDEEQMQAQQAAQQPPPPDPNMVLAQAEMQKAQADMLAQQNKQSEIQLKAADVQAKYQGQADKLQSETALNMAKVQQGQTSLDLQAQKQLNEFALKLADLEAKVGRDLNAEIQQNKLVYNPATGLIE